MHTLRCELSSSKLCQGFIHLGLFLLGALVLSIFSVFQKRLLGVDISLDLRGYIVPVLFGGTTGLLVSNFVTRLSISNAKLKQSRAYLQDFIDNASDLIQSISPEGKILYTNRTWQETMGYSASELENFNIFDLISEEYRHHCQAQMKEVLDGKTTHANFALVAKNGEKVFLDGMINCRFEAGRPVSTRGVLRNVTQTRKAEEKLLLAAKVFENVNDGIFVTDLSAKIIAANHAFTEITGYLQEDVFEKMPSTFIFPEDNSPKVLEDMHRGLRTLNCWQGEVIVRHKNRGPFPVLIKITAVKDEEEITLHYVGMLTDITLQKETEERLRHLATHDILTNLPNRMLFVDRLQRAVWQAEQTGHKLAVLYIDLDGFKEINDTYGHGPGDAFLKVIAQRLSVCVGSHSLARLGGDEFAILLEQIESEKDALGIARNILVKVSAPVLIESNKLTATASIGISLYPNCPNPNSLLSEADTAMYKAKAKGKNAVAFLS